MDHELATGLYTIRTIPSLQLVGRNIVEDDSFKPKGVFGQPRGVPVNDNTTFLLRHVGADSFYISCGRDHGRVVELEGKVVAALHEVELDDPFDYSVNQLWAIRPQPQHGEDVFTIESESGYWGWVMPTETPQYTPVAVRALVSSSTMPPMYPPNELWVIERIG
ncbi:hypothetical protein P691DRAFT_671915 [Macrolepiota fuliginosa MF-IS2]|uniref:Uncharacterized protein n=1 Tax=Macrolepiota fuliginosa MF-IS2 TaxID=1400762 RepID=A0A9P5XA35_9AGAR|nr:hypothetical protein P691DRAFT_671915 [Macrolepiota fuliginosa MF-IS2]